MPRSAADRAFGFKATGLLRILLAADPDELLKALDELGIVIVRPTGLFAAIRALAESFAGPAVDVIDLWGQLTRSIDRLISDLLSIEDLTAAQARLFLEDANAAAEEQNALDSDIRRLQAARVTFQGDLDALEQQTEEEIAITFL